MKPDQIRGHLDLVLLGVISHGAAHGYEVITRLRQDTDGTLDLTEGAVYPALHRLEDAGLLTSQWQPVAGRRRRLYSLTSTGHAALSAQRHDFRTLVAAVERVITPTNLAVVDAS